MPAWWRDAKLGIFVHWTPASVAGWAPTDHEIGELMASGGPDPMASVPYIEWYENSLRFPDSPVARHHRATYGSRPYESFADDYRAGLAEWDPTDWARRFRATGARYVVLVTKHHDGFCLWPSGVRNPNRDHWSTDRDVVGELAEAVRGEGLRFGVYYSGGLDWTFDDRPIGQFSDLLRALPRGAYPAYAEAHLRELVARYRPDVIWNDIMWPTGVDQLKTLVTDYRQAVPDGVMNDRFMPWNRIWPIVTSPPSRRLIDGVATRQARRSHGTVPPRPPLYDVRTPEYTVYPEIQHEAWECVRGMDRSFGYNRNSAEEQFLSHEELLWSFVDIVAKGGNLLLNVGPRGEDAQIPAEQLRRLDWLADFLGPNADGVAGTRPWVKAGTSCGGRDVRYWAHDQSVIAAIRGGGSSGEVVLDDVQSGALVSADHLGGGHAVVRPEARGLHLQWSGGADAPVTLVRLNGVVAASPSS